MKLDFNSLLFAVTLEQLRYTRRMLRLPLILALLFTASTAATAQWTIQDSRTTADLRGVHSIGKGVAWASGTSGTILRTTDGGAHWQPCSVPPGAEKLDFRAVWAWSAAEDAEVMSAGPGELSRIYLTTDGCATWKETARNEEKDGFWDAMVYQNGNFGFAIGDAHTAVMIGDPVKGRFETRVMLLGHGWFIDGSSCAAQPDESAFAASNSSVFLFGSRRYILVTGGKGGSRALISPLLWAGRDSENCIAVPLPLASGDEASGAFSVFFRDLKHGVVVGGNYKKPTESAGTAAYTSDGGRHWNAAATPPHGYRASVAWDEAAKCWIAVGINGTDISGDDAKTWRAVEDGNWNALSLPFVVGPKGRIGKLRTDVLKP